MGWRHASLVVSAAGEVEAHLLGRRGGVALTSAIDLYGICDYIHMSSNLVFP